VPQLCCDCEACASHDPRDKRLRASALITVDGKRLLIDCGPDFRQQMLSHHIHRLDAILITHEHYDHVGGLDDVRSYGSINLYAERRVNNVLRNTMYYSFDVHKYPGVPEMVLNDIEENVPFQAGEVSVLPLRVMHARLPIIGFRTDNVAYITDAKSLPETSLEQLYGLDILVLGTLRFQPHFSHFSMDESLALIDMLKPGQTYFTHISHAMGTHKEVEKQLPENVYLAYDGLVVKIE